MTFPKFKSDGTIKRFFADLIKKSELEIYLIAIYETWIHFRWGQMCAEGLGCNQEDSLNTQIQCLQELPVDDIVESGIIVGFRGAQAVVDGSFSDEPFLPDHPKSLMSSGMYNKNVNILLGSNRLTN